MPTASACTLARMPRGKGRAMRWPDQQGPGTGAPPGPLTCCCSEGRSSWMQYELASARTSVTGGCSGVPAYEPVADLWAARDASAPVKYARDTVSTTASALSPAASVALWACGASIFQPPNARAAIATTSVSENRADTLRVSAQLSGPMSPAVADLERLRDRSRLDRKNEGTGMDTATSGSGGAVAPPTVSEAFWALIDASWSVVELSELVALCKAMEDAFARQRPW